MREILFRGKRRDNGEWVEGFIGGLHSYETESTTGKITRIRSYYLNHQSVDADTVGQYIGLTDKNGKKIFEGDIVKAIYKSNYIGLPDTDFGVGVIKYDDTYYGGASYKINIIGDIGARIFSSNVEVEVIGNIHEKKQKNENEGN